MSQRRVLLIGGNSTTMFDYDPDGNITRIVRPDNLQIGFSYNTGGQLQTKTTPTGNYGYTYSPTTGQVTQLTAPGGISTTFGYDGFLLTGNTLAGPVAGSVSVGYNDSFLVSSVAVNNTATVNYSYDNDDFPTEAGASQSGRAALPPLFSCAQARA